MWITVLLRTPAAWLSRQECPWSRVGATEIAIVIVGSQKEPAYWPGIPDPEASYGAADAPHARNHRRHCSADADRRACRYRLRRSTAVGTGARLACQARRWPSAPPPPGPRPARSEEHTSELQSPMRSSYAVVCL